MREKGVGKGSRRSRKKGRGYKQPPAKRRTRSDKGTLRKAVKAMRETIGAVAVGIVGAVAILATVIVVGVTVLVFTGSAGAQTPPYPSPPSPEGTHVPGQGSSGDLVPPYPLPYPSKAAHKHGCKLFPGPGDNIIHMTRFQVKHYGCVKAKHVVKAGFRCGECHVFTAKHHRWRTNLGFPGQHWISGKRRIWIEWGD